MNTKFDLHSFITSMSSGDEKYRADDYIRSFVGNVSNDIPTIDKMKKMIDAGLVKSVDVPDHYRNYLTALMVLADNGSEEAMEWLLIKGANPNKLGGTDYLSPLIYAIRSDNYNKVRILLENGANPNFLTENMNTALMYAVNKSYINKNTRTRDIIKILLDYGADINIKNKKGYTAMDMANAKGNDLGKLLINKNKDEVISVKPKVERIARYTEKINKTSIGGGNSNTNNNDKMKYLKYKAKYLQLKNQLN